jgi:hypothetical protein
MTPTKLHPYPLLLDPLEEIRIRPSRLVKLLLRLRMHLLEPCRKGLFQPPLLQIPQREMADDLRTRDRLCHSLLLGRYRLPISREAQGSGKPNGSLIDHRYVPKLATESPLVPMKLIQQAVRDLGLRAPMAHLMVPRSKFPYPFHQQAALAQLHHANFVAVARVRIRLYYPHVHPRRTHLRPLS